MLILRVLNKRSKNTFHSTNFRMNNYLFKSNEKRKRGMNRGNGNKENKRGRRVRLHFDF